MQPETQPRTLGSPFSADQLADWRHRLLDQARALRADVDALEVESVLQERVAPSHHLPEAASELQVAAVDASAATTDEEVLRLVLRAIEKIDTGRPVPFGLCELTGREIERERLELMPWAPCSAEASARLDRDAQSQDDLLLP